MLTLKQRAAIEVAKLLALVVVIGIGSGILLSTVPLAIIGIGACIIILAYGGKQVYEMKLEELEAENKLKS